jgi:hypothetical protein
MRTRRETVEHPFGTMKMRMGATHFLIVSSGANIDKNHRFKIRQGGTHSSRPSNLAAVLGPIKAEP